MNNRLNYSFRSLDTLLCEIPSCSAIAIWVFFSVKRDHNVCLMSSNQINDADTTFETRFPVPFFLWDAWYAKILANFVFVFYHNKNFTKLFAKIYKDFQ